MDDCKDIKYISECIHLSPHDEESYGIFTKNTNSKKNHEWCKVILKSKNSYNYWSIKSSDKTLPKKIKYSSCEECEGCSCKLNTIISQILSNGYGFSDRKQVINSEIVIG